MLTGRESWNLIEIQKIYFYLFIDVLFYCLSAATKRHQRCLDIVLAHGANVNNTTDGGTPVLVMACEMAVENETMCLMLLEKGADPNARSSVSWEIYLFLYKVGKKRLYFQLLLVHLHLKKMYVYWIILMISYMEWIKPNFIGNETYVVKPFIMYFSKIT